MIYNECFNVNKQIPNDLFYIRQAGTLNRDKTYCIVRTGSSTIVVGYVESGRLLLHYNNKKIELGEGCSFVLANGLNYKIFSDENMPPVMHWLNLRGAFAENALISLNLSPCSVAKVNLTHNFECIKDLMAKNVDCYYEIVSEVMAVLCLIGSNRIEKELPEPEKNSMAERFDAYLSNNIQSPFSVKIMAEHFNISTDTLNRRFHALFGKAPYRYYEEIRTDIAKTLLLQSDIPIKDIAARLNYIDRNHFSVGFKRVCGESPAGYRKSHHDSLL